MDRNRRILTVQQLVSLCCGAKHKMKLETRGNPMSTSISMVLLKDETPQTFFGQLIID